MRMGSACVLMFERLGLRISLIVDYTKTNDVVRTAPPPTHHPSCVSVAAVC